MDAPRVQLCPFKDRESLDCSQSQAAVAQSITDTVGRAVRPTVTSPFCAGLEELWFGVAFDPLEETLSWELVCPVPTGVALCQKRGDGVCVDLPQAFRNVTSGKVRAFTFLCLRLLVMVARH